MTDQEFREKVFERLGAIDNRLKHDPVRTIALVVAALCLIAAGVSGGFAITSREALNDQRATNQLLLCAQGRSVAAAAAFRSQRPAESRDEFVDRMLAQRFQLLAISSLDCTKLPGFDTFDFQRGKALSELDDILRRLAPRRYRQVIKAEGKNIFSTAPQGSSAPSPATAAAPNLPPPADSGGIGEPGPSGGHGDSTGGPGDAPPKSHPPPPAKTGNDGGHEEADPGTTTPVTATVEQPPPPPPSEGEEAGEGSTASNEQSVLSPVLDETCKLPVASKALCTPR